MRYMYEAGAFFFMSLINTDVSCETLQHSGNEIALYIILWTRSNTDLARLSEGTVSFFEYKNRIQYKSDKVHYLTNRVRVLQKINHKHAAVYFSKKHLAISNFD